VIDILWEQRTSVDFIEALVSGPDTACTCAVVAAEVFTGTSLDERVAAETLLRGLEFLNETFDVGRRAGEWRYDFARKGVALATTDVLIAAVALQHDVTLVTGNTRDFPMPGIRLLELPRPNRRR